jgi:hypothetical protein
MAHALLKEVAAGGSSGGSGSVSVSGRARWLAALPQHVPLPWLHWGDAELAELQDPVALQEALQLQAMFEDECQVPRWWRKGQPSRVCLPACSPRCTKAAALS